MTWRGFSHIAPRGEGLTKEPFGVWYPRVKGEIPWVPEAVAESWLYENWGGSPYEWLSLRKLRFERHRWTSAEVLRIDEELEPTERNWSSFWGDELVRPGSHHSGIRLGRYMRENGAWPVPIIVLDNPGRRRRDPRGRRLARFHLLEGHMRLAFLRALIEKGAAQDQHDVWLTTFAAR